MPGSPRPSIAPWRVHERTNPRPGSESSRCACSTSSGPGRRASERRMRPSGRSSAFPQPATIRCCTRSSIRRWLCVPILCSSGDCSACVTPVPGPARPEPSVRIRRSTRTPPSNGQLPAGPVRRGPRRTEARRRAPSSPPEGPRRDRLRLGGARDRHPRRRRTVRPVARQSRHHVRPAGLRRRRRRPGRDAVVDRLERPAGHRPDDCRPGARPQHLRAQRKQHRRPAEHRRRRDQGGGLAEPRPRTPRRPATRTRR